MDDHRPEMDPDLAEALGGDIFAALQREMRPGERVLWKSRQHQRLFGSGSIAAWFFAIPWTAFSLFWTGMAYFLTRSNGAPSDPMAVLFPAFGLPFVAIGVGMLTQPFLRYFGAKYTVFAVTNQRVIRLFKRDSVLVQSVPAERIGKVKIIEDDDAHGTLSFKLKGKAGDYEPKGSKFVLHEVDDVDRAKKLIRELAKSAKD